jgi:hypothetical protein
MRRWIIPLLGAGPALAFDFYWLRPELQGDLPGLGLIVSSNVASIAVSSLAMYAGIVLLLSTAITLVDLRRVRSRLSAVLSPTRGEWFASFEGTGLARLAARLLDLADEETSVSGQAVLRFRFDIGFGRQEIRYKFRNSLTRVHFFTALVALIGMAGLGWAREQALFALPGLAIPGGPIFAVVAALVALFALATLAVNAAAEPLLDEIADLRFGRLDDALVRAVAVVCEARADVFQSGSDKTLEPTIIERLTESVEALTTILHATSERPGQDPDLDVRKLSDLKIAMDRLTATLERLPAVLQQPASGSAPTNPGQIPREGDLRRDLRELLNEFE